MNMVIADALWTLHTRPYHAQICLSLKHVLLLLGFWICFQVDKSCRRMLITKNEVIPSCEFSVFSFQALHTLGFKKLSLCNSMTAPKIRKTSLDTAPLQKLDRDLRLNGRECQKLSVRIFLANIDALSQCPPWESLSKMSSLSRAQCSFPHQDDMSPDIQVPVCVLWLSFRFDGPSPANFPRNKVSRYF